MTPDQINRTSIPPSSSSFSSSSSSSTPYRAALPAANERTFARAPQVLGDALSIGFLGGGQMCEALLGGLLAQGTTEASPGGSRLVGPPAARARRWGSVRSEMRLPVRLPRGDERMCRSARCVSLRGPWKLIMVGGCRYGGKSVCTDLGAKGFVLGGHLGRGCLEDWVFGLGEIGLGLAQPAPIQVSLTFWGVQLIAQTGSSFM